MSQYLHSEVYLFLYIIYDTTFNWCSGNKYTNQFSICSQCLWWLSAHHRYTQIKSLSLLVRSFSMTICYILLYYSEKHICAVFDMLQGQKHRNILRCYVLNKLSRRHIWTCNKKIGDRQSSRLLFYGHAIQRFQRWNDSRLEIPKISLKDFILKSSSRFEVL